MLYLILIFTILFTGLAWFRPVLAVQLTLFCLPAYLLRFNIGVPMTVLELMILINFAVWLGKNFGLIIAGLKNRYANNGQHIEYPFGWEMILVAMVGLLGVAVASFSNEALGIWKAYFFEPILFLLVIYQVVGRLEIEIEKKYQKLVCPLALSALVVAVLAIYQKITGNLIDTPLWQASETRRVVSLFGYPNAVGLYLETIIIYCFGLLILFRKTNIKKSLSSFYLLTFILSLLAIAFAKSNGAVLGLLAGFSIFSLLYSRRTRLIFGFVVVVSSLLLFGQTSTRTKALEYITLNDFSGQVRRIGWQESWNMLRDGRLIFGAGLSNFQPTVLPYHVAGFYFNRDRDPDFHRKTLIFDQAYRDKYWQPLEVYMYPHNIVLNFWSEVGLLGLLVFIWLLAKFYFLASRYLSREAGNRRVLIITAISAMTVTVVHGLVDVPFFKNDLAVLFWLPIVIIGLYKLEEHVKLMVSK